MIPVRVLSERLIGRAPVAGDECFLSAILNDPECARWLTPDGKTPPLERAGQVLDVFQTSWVLRLIGPWLWFDKRGDPNGERMDGFRGYGGFFARASDPSNRLELLYAVPSAHWGQGYATEIATAALEQVPALTEDTDIVGFVLPGNMASQAVMRKVGLVEAGETLHAGLTHNLYEF